MRAGQSPRTRHGLRALFALTVLIGSVAGLVLGSGPPSLTPVNAVATNGQAAADDLGQLLPSGSTNFNSSTVNNPMNVGVSGASGASIDAVNHKAYVADTNNNRVLVFGLNTDNTFPDYKADFIIGQADYASTSANRGSATPAANSLKAPSRVRVDPATGNVYVSDTGNNRVLIFSSVTASDPNASFVIGANDFTSTNSGGTVSPTRMLSPSGIAFSGSGATFSIYIADKDFNRVLEFAAITGNGQAAVHVLGQSTFTSSAPALSQTGLASPVGVDATSSGDVYVADTGNSRVMIWTGGITSDGQSANAVIGQTWFYSNGTGVTSASMAHPRDVTINASNGNVWVVDSDNNRVLVYNTSISGGGQAANFVLGQTDFTSSGGGTSSTKLNLPVSAIVIGNLAMIADVSNNRVVGYTSAITASGQAASYSLGQQTTAGTSDFFGNTPNNPQDKGFNKPSGVAINTVGKQEFVADTGNNRVLVFNLDAAMNPVDHYADYVLGQTSFSYTLANGGGAVSASTLNAPAGVTYDTVNQRLYIADTGNNRVLVYTSAIVSSGQAANFALGQSSLTTNSPTVSQSGMASPEAIGVNPGATTVAVADRDNNRVLVWKTLPTANGQNATYVVGQSSFTANGFNTTSSTLHTPRGVSFDQNSGYLYVADSDNNRVLTWTAAITANNQAAAYVLGQSSFTSATAQTLSSSSLNHPLRVTAGLNSGVLYVADTGNNRALIWTSAILANNQAANTVIGQSNFTTSGAATSQTGMNAPTDLTAEGVGGKVFVADTTNNRVLSYSNAAPNTPTGTSPAASATNVSSTPTFQMSAVEPDGDALQYRIDIAQNSTFTTGLVSFNQNSSSTGWTGTNLGNAYALGALGSFTLPAANLLSANTVYYWRVAAYDPYGSKTWTANSTTMSFTTAPPYSIAITSTAQSVPAGQASGAIHIVLRDSNGNLVKPGTSQRIYLSTNDSTGLFSTAASPFVSATYVDIPANSSGVDVYYRGSTVGNFTMTFSDATPANGATGLIDATQNITITANSVTNFIFGNIGAQIAGTPFTVTISAVDAFGNVVPTYNITANLTSTLETPVPTTATFTAGTWSGSVTLTMAGNIRLTASAGSASGNSNFFTLNPGALDHAVNTPGTVTVKAAATTNLTTAAYDLYNNLITTGLTYLWTPDAASGTVSPSNAATTTLTAASLVTTSGNVTVGVTSAGITVNATTVVTITPDHYVFSAIPSIVTAGANIATTVTAVDANGATVTNATNSVAIDDSTHTIYPQSINMVNGTWTGNFQITKASVGIAMSASGYSGTITGTSNNFEVDAAALDHVGGTPSSTSLSVNTNTTLTGTAYDQYGNPIAGQVYNWTTNIGSIPTTGQSVSFSAGSIAGTGSATISVTQTGVTKTVNIPITITANSVDHFSFSAIPDQTAGVSFTITIQAKDQYENTVTNYTGQGSLTYSSGAISPATTTAFSNGTWTGSVRVTTAGTGVSLTYNDALHTGTSAPFNVNPGVITSVSTTPVSATLALNASQLLTAHAFDTYGNEVSSGLSISWLLNDTSLATLSPTSGPSSTVTAKTKAGNTTTTVTVTQGATQLSNNTVITITPGALDHFSFDQISSPQPTGQQIGVKIYAKDAYENTVTTFNTPATLTDLSNSVLPTQTANFGGGTWTGYVTVAVPYGRDIITATGGGVSGGSNQFDVISNVLDHVVITPSSSIVGAGGTQAFSAQSYDSLGNAILGLNYSWSVQGTLGTVSPATGVATTFTAGSATGTDIVQVTVSQGAVTKTANAAVTIKANSLDHFVFTPIATVTAGQPTYVTITAKDSFNNTITDFTNSIALSDTLSGITSTATGPVSQGAWTGQVSFDKAGTDNLTATYGAVQTTSAPFVVAPDVLYAASIDQTSFAISAGQTKPVTGSGTDRFGNVIPGLTYSWSIPSVIGTADSTSNQTVNITAATTAANGTINLLVTQGSNTVTKSIDATVEADDLSQFTFAQINSPQIVGAPFSITIQATDKYGNVLDNFNQSVTLSDDTGTISPTQSTNFSNGQWAGQVTLTAANDADHITAKNGAISTASNAFQVKAGVQQVFLTVVSGANQTASVGGNTPQPLTVKAVDLYGNPMSNVKIDYAIASTPADAGGQALTPDTVTTGDDGTGASTLKLGNRSGSYVVAASIDGRSSVSVNFYTMANSSGVASVNITPSDTTVLSGGAQQYSIQALDSFGNPVNGLTPTYRVVNGGGTVDNNGLFTAGGSPGVFKDTVVGSIGGVSASASVTVTLVSRPRR